MRPLLLIALVCSGCYRHAIFPIVSRDAVEELESSASDELGCEEVEVRPLTLLTRVVEGCGERRIYAFEPLREKWVLSSVEKR